MSALTDAIATLNARQREAFDTIGHCVIAAPPGSGKTKLLVTRLASDLLTSIERPHGAACITLTNAAASEVHDRFHTLSADDRPNLFIGTVHGFALNKIVRPYAHLIRLESTASMQVASSRDTDIFWEAALDEQGISDPQDRRQVKSTVKRYRSLMIPIDSWNDKQLTAAKHAYSAQLASAGMIDFAEMVELAVLLVEDNPLVRAALRAAFPRIYVDEYQDLAPGLDRIIRALCFGNESDLATLFAVGDVDQAIYGWTGTDSRLLEQVAGLPGVTKVLLELNYRNGTKIVELSRRLFQHQSPAVAQREGGYVRVEKVPGMMPGQFGRIASLVSDLRADSVPLNQIAVFMRTNALADEVASHLESRNIPCWVKISEDWESPLSILFERFAAWMAHGNDSSGFNLATLIAELRRTVPGANTDAIGRAAVRITSSSDAIQGVEFVKGLHADLSASGSPELKLFLSGELDRYVAELESGALSALTFEELGSRRLTGERVYVTTLASCKGLEFDYVFIPDMDDGRIPFFGNFNSPSAMEEERNKFYVGLTRARHGVTLLWSGSTPTKYGPRRSEVSRFIRTIGLA